MHKWKLAKESRSAPNKVSFFWTCKSSLVDILIKVLTLIFRERLSCPNKMSTVKKNPNFLRRFCTALLLSTLHLSSPTNGDEILGKTKMKLRGKGQKAMSKSITRRSGKAPSFLSPTRVSLKARRAKTTVCVFLHFPILQWSRSVGNWSGNKNTHTDQEETLSQLTTTFGQKRIEKRAALICPFI